MSRKIKKKRITLKEALDRIPHDEFYCLDSGRCPYFQIRHFSKNKMIKLARKYQIIGIPVWYARRHELEYCAFLRTYLSIQDGVKDCDINCDFTQEQYDHIIEYMKKDSDTFTEKDIEEVEKPYSHRIKYRESADALKEMFPDEADLVDKIVEEDKIKYFKDRHRPIKEEEEE